MSYVNGGVSFYGTADNNTSGTVLDPRSITSVKKTSGSGDFTQITNFFTLWGNFLITSPMSNTFNISSTSVGTFIGTLTSDNGDTGITDGNGGRTIVYNGYFEANFGTFEPTGASLTIVLNQSTTPPNTVFSTSVTMTTTGLPPPVDTIPTTTTLVIEPSGNQAYGDDVTLTAYVVHQSSLLPVISGNVEFLEINDSGNVSLGNVAVVSGNAILESIDFENSYKLKPGPKTIEAKFTN
jgi:hypothetical protein